MSEISAPQAPANPGPDDGKRPQGARADRSTAHAGTAAEAGAAHARARDAGRAAARLTASGPASSYLGGDGLVKFL